MKLTISPKFIENYIAHERIHLSSVHSALSLGTSNNTGWQIILNLFYKKNIVKKRFCSCRLTKKAATEVCQNDNLAG